MDAPTPKSIFARKRDLLYLTFFAIHIPIVFCTPSATHASILRNDLQLTWSLRR